jgi:hypothetical protein
MKHLLKSSQQTLWFSIILLFILLWSEVSQAQSKFTISGKVKDAQNGEELIGASIVVKELGIGNTSNTYGFYSLTVPQGNYTLVFSYIGFTTQEIPVELNQNKTIDIQLVEEVALMEEVVVVGEDVDANVSTVEMGTARLDIKTIQRMPALLGEVDVIRSIQMTPGVSTVGEGASGFNVRGGSVDQNLILLDEAPVYNSSHLFGLFSVFNPDAVKDVKLIKGGIPAQYGGRLSSILDVRMKEGNSKKFAGSGGIGSISSRFAIEAPIVKDKSSFILAARRTYIDALGKLAGVKELKDNAFYFYDLSAKFNYNINDNNRIFISGYFGRDVFKFSDDFKSDWGNATGTIRWNHLFSKKLFSNFTFVYSNYDYSLGVPSGAQAFEWKSNIVTLNAKADFNYYMNPKNTFNFGVSAIKYDINPGKFEPKSDKSIFNTTEADKQDAMEYAAYLDHEEKIGSRWSLQYGVRFSYYQFLGPGTFYDYVGEDGKRKLPVNEKTYEKGEVVADYYNFEPRASLNFKLNESSSIKASYNRTAQYIHLISNTTAAAPTDIWSPSTQNIKPQLADQVAIGYFRNFKDNTFETSAEIYYKEMSNQIDYIDGANTLLNVDLEGDLLYGKGRSYGLELFVKKNSGKLTGWLSYTLSKSERQINGLNNNDWYNAKYDRTHNLSLVGIYELNKRWSFSANLAYATGVSTTFPNGRYEYDGMIIPHNTDGSRNNYRVPAYHRLDIAATLEGREKPGRRFHGQWVFSIYNVYARKNAFTVYFRQNEDNPTKTEAVRLSVFGSLLPSVTYNFKF